MAAVIETEFREKAMESSLDFAPLHATGLAGRAQAIRALVGAGMELADAPATAGVDQDSRPKRKRDRIKGPPALPGRETQSEALMPHPSQPLQAQNETLDHPREAAVPLPGRSVLEDAGPGRPGGAP